MSRLRLLLWFCLVAFQVSLALAQAPEPGTDGMARLQRKVTHGDSAQVSLRDGNMLAARRLGLSDRGVLQLDGVDGPRLSDLGEIRVRVSAAGRGAGIGAVAGGLFGLAAGIAMANDQFFDVGGGEVALFTGVTAAAGAAAGALIGLPFHRWKRIYSASAPRMSLLVRPLGANRVALGASLRF